MSLFTAAQLILLPEQSLPAANLPTCAPENCEPYLLQNKNISPSWTENLPVPSFIRLPAKSASQVCFAPEPLSQHLTLI